MIQLTAHEASKMLAWIAQEHAYYVAKIIEDPSVMYRYEAVTALEWMKVAMIVIFEHASEEEFQDFQKKECKPVIEA